METAKLTTSLTPALSFDIRTNRTEVRRRLIVRAILFIYVLSLIEGPLRKWFLPGLAGPLTLLRDPFVIMLYAYCFITGMIWTRGIARPWLVFAVVTSFVGLPQYALSGLGPHHWMLGVRTYWLYMPLAFIVARTFRSKDIHFFLRLNIIIAIPYALLVAQQYRAPSMAFINLGVGGDEDSTVGLTTGIVRPFGLFTYTGPNVQFTAAMIAMFIAFYVGRVKIRGRSAILLVSGVAVGAMSVLTGSRSIYFLAASILGLTIGGIMVARPSARSLMRTLGILGFVLISSQLFLFVFPDMFDAMTIRFETAAEAEGTVWARAFGSIFSWVDVIWTAPIFGAGIGAGAPGVALFIGSPALIYGEGDLERNLNELGPVLGLAMLALRFGTAAGICRVAYHSAKAGEAMALPFAGFVVFEISVGQITHSPLNAFMVWLMLGLIISLRARLRNGG